MLRKLLRIDIPPATEANILHAAAFLEFKQHVERLAREGHDLAAYTCWVHAVEIRHSPFVIPTTSQSELFPPWSKCPAARETVSVAQLTCGGLVSWRVAQASMPSLLGPAVWITPCGDFLQLTFQIGGIGKLGSVPTHSNFTCTVQTAIPGIGLALFRRCHNGSGQWAVNQLRTMIGSPFAADKRQLMQHSGTFLGLTHNLADINCTGHVKFWARARLHDKVKEIIYNARATGKFTCGTFQIARCCQLPRTMRRRRL